ncbi:MAG: M23 family metallopeptidase [Ruminococcus sp.]|nr:M23 family metallopeptidase [Ruminococcus sp.]
MKSIKETKLAQLLGGKGAYITLAAAVLAAGGAGVFAYAKAVETAEESYDFSISQSDTSSVEEADTKQSGVEKEDSSSEEESGKIVQTQPNVMPVNGEILEPFSNGELVKSETLNVWKTHDGVDIAADVGTAVKAMNSGEVTQVEEDTLWGYTVIIDHGNGIMGYYYNLSSAVTVAEGDEVESGQTIGAVGDTAEIESAMQSHLHFALKKNGEWIDPISYIDPISEK